MIILKVLIYADPHCTQYPQGLVDLKRECSLAVFNEIYCLAYKEGCDLAICAGDFFHSSALKARDAAYVKRIFDFIKSYQSIDTWIISGNHDRSSLEDSLLNAFSHYYNLEIIDTIKYVSYRGVDFALASFGYEDELHSRDDWEIAVVHSEYSGAWMNTSKRKSTSRRDPNFKNNQIVISGHLHCPSKTGSVIFPGSVMPVAFGELPQKKYPQVIIYDSETKSISYHSIKSALMPVSIDESQFEEFWTWYNPQDYNHIKLRITYAGDRPFEEDPRLSRLASVEWRKALQEKLDDSVEMEIEVEDVLVNVEEHCLTFIDQDKTVPAEDKDPIKNLCSSILS